MKKPTEEEFWKQWDYYKENPTAMSEHFECSTRSIYNWLHEFEDIKAERIKNQIKTISLDVSSDIEEQPVRSFSYFIDKQKESPNQPDTRETTISIPKSGLIVMIADCHFGSKYTDVDLAEEVKASCVMNDDVYAIYNGDLVDYEGTGPPDIKYDQWCAHPNTTRAMAESYIREFNGKMLLMLTGCHDNWTYKWTGETFTERLVKHIPTRAVFHDTVMLNLNVGKVGYYGKVGHKAGVGGSRYNPSHGLFQDVRENFDGDFVISAHKHKPGIAVQFIRQKPVIAVNCGAFKTVDFYANKQFHQQPLSIPAVYFDGETKRMVPFFDWRDGIRYIKTLESSPKNTE